MTPKKILTIIIALLMLAALPLTGFAAEDNAKMAADTDITVRETDAPDAAEVVPMPMPAFPVVNQNEPEYAYVEGTITEINDYGEDGKQIIRIAKNENENEWDVVTDSGTYYITCGKTNRKAMGVDDIVKVFYNVKAPALMIYPPRINAECIAIGLDGTQSVVIGRFDEDFINTKNELKLNIPDDLGDIEIVYEDGRNFDGGVKDLVSRKLIVVYSKTTRSIPAQTTPEKVIIMYEKAVAPIYILTEEEKEMVNKSLSNQAIQINSEKLESPGAFMNESGIIMVPVRAVAEAMGLHVEWYGDTKTVQIGKSLSFTIGKDSYAYNRKSPISLGTAPILKESMTYVPIDFFCGSFENLSVDYRCDGNINIIYDKTE